MTGKGCAVGWRRRALALVFSLMLSMVIGILTSRRAPRHVASIPSG
jgi:hypothetical protein